MDASNDLILGVLSGQKYMLKYEGVEAYLVSIERSGFKGRKIMLVWNIHPLTRRLLTESGFEVIDVQTPPEAEEFFHARVRLTWNYLRYHYQDFRYIFWLDIKDLILQSDPSVWLEQNLGEHKLIAGSECVTIEQEWTNQVWARAVLGDERYATIKDELVLNGGTWAGEAALVTQAFGQIYEITRAYNGPYPPCQPATNYVLRQEPFKSALYVPSWSEGFAACLHPFWSWDYRDKLQPFVRDHAPVLDPETRLLHPGCGVVDPTNRMAAFGGWQQPGLNVISAEKGPLAGVELVKNPVAKPFAIVHGYDRDWSIRTFMEEKYTLTENEVWFGSRNNGGKVSIFTPTHNSSFLRETYKSLEAQTDPNWEWIIIYNNDGEPIGFDDLRVKEVKVYHMPEWVGPLKAKACEYATGDILLELDHDDLLTPDCVAEVRAAFADPEIGFVYSNTIHATGEWQKIPRFDERYGWKFREVEYQGHKLDEHISFDPTPEVISRIWFAPNHVRAFRRSVYEQVGGYNTGMRILDDLDLMCRMYLVTKFKRIDKGLYIYRVHGENSWLRYNQEIQDNVFRIYDQYIEALVERSCELRGLRKIEVGGRMAAKPGYETVDLKDASIIANLNKRWPFPDSSIGCIRSFDVFEHLKNSIHTMKEVHRVLAPGGWLICQVPSTDGRGAFQDPTHVSFWNINSFQYYTNAEKAKYIDTPVRFQAPRLHDTERNADGVIWTKAHLICLKDGYRPCGDMPI